MADNTELLDGIAVFVYVVDGKSFTAASDRLGHSTSYISKTISKLEKRLGLRLLNRTTRTLSLTDAGKTYYERCKQLVIDAQDAERAIGQLHENPRGHLKVSAPVSFGLSHLTACLPEFAKAYPDVVLDIDFTEKLVDVVEGGYDVVVRVRALKDSNFVARKIMDSEGVTIASPGYLKERGTPKLPSDLEHHDCICYSNISTPSHWEFTSEKNGAFNVQVKPRMYCNSAELELAMVLNGIGVTRMPRFACEKELQDGSLVTILDDFALLNFGVYAMFPHRQFVSAKVRVFVDFLVDWFKDK